MACNIRAPRGIAEGPGVVDGQDVLRYDDGLADGVDHLQLLNCAHGIDQARRDIAAWRRRPRWDTFTVAPL